jgi:dTMP kinase
MLIRLALSRRLRGSSGEYHAKDAETIHPPSDLDPYTLALLYASDRMDHAANEIIPNLRYGRIVICDRYLMSTLAYQGLSVDEEWLFQINRFAPIPDLCIYFDLPVEYAKDRMQRTRWTRDLYEEENKLRQIRERYLRLASNPRPEIGPILLVDATQRIEIVGKKVRKAIEPFLGQSETQKSKVNLSLFEWPKE